MMRELVLLEEVSERTNISTPLLRYYCRKKALKTATKINGTRWAIQEREVIAIERGLINFSGVFVKNK